jgi:hypothetical protein
MFGLISGCFWVWKWKILMRENMEIGKSRWAKVWKFGR